MKAAPGPVTLPGRHFAYTVTLEAHGRAPDVVVCRDLWRTALALAAMHGWPARVLSTTGDVENLLTGNGQQLGAEDQAEIAAGLRAALARLDAGTAKAWEPLRTRGTSLDTWWNDSQLVLGHIERPFAKLLERRARMTPAEAKVLPERRGLASLADALERGVAVTLSRVPPAGWLNPNEATVAVEVLPHPNAPECLYTVRGQPRPAGERLRIASRDLPALSARGVVRRLSDDEAAGLRAA